MMYIFFFQGIFLLFIIFISFSSEFVNNFNKDVKKVIFLKYKEMTLSILFYERGDDNGKKFKSH